MSERVTEEVLLTVRGQRRFVDLFVTNLDLVSQAARGTFKVTVRKKIVKTKRVYQ
jgi:hypothetical protein